MAGSEEPQAKGSWERAGVRIGVLVVAIGLLLALLHLPQDIATALGDNVADKTARLDLERKRTEVEATRPRLDVSYLLVDESLEGSASAPVIRGHHPLATTVLSFPEVENDIITDLTGEHAPHRRSSHACRFAPEFAFSTGYLVLRNIGRRVASDVSIHLDRFRPRRAVIIRERRPSGGDYRDRLQSSKTRSAKPVVVTLPQTLGPGDGVRVPLFERKSRFTNHSVWCLVSRSVYVPARVQYADVITQTTWRAPARRMVSPVYLADGIQARG